MIQNAHLAEAKRFGLADHPFLVKPAKLKDGLNHVRSAAASKEYADPFSTAIEYACLGENEEAFNWLKKAYQDRSAMMVQLKVTPDLDKLRSDPRFQQLLSRMNIPH